jgi:transcriptional regulator with XRE-family HTH domain
MAAGKRIGVDDWASVLVDCAAGLSQAEAADRAMISSAAVRRWKKDRHSWWEIAVAELRSHLADGQPRGVVVQRARELVLGREPERVKLDTVEQPLTWAAFESALRSVVSGEIDWPAHAERAARIAGVATPEEIPADRVLAVGWQVFRDPRPAAPREECAS